MERAEPQSSAAEPQSSAEVQARLEECIDRLAERFTVLAQRVETMQMRLYSFQVRVRDLEEQQSPNYVPSLVFGPLRGSGPSQGGGESWWVARGPYGR